MRKQSVIVSHTLSTLSVITLIIVWQIYAIRVNNPHLMPDPIRVFTEFFRLLGDGNTYRVIFSTLLRLVLSIALASFFGLLLGLMSGVRYQLEAFLMPLVTSLRTLPIISIIVVIWILFGSGVSLYIISFLLLFPILYQSELDGIKNIDPLLLDVLELDCSECAWGAVSMVYFPLALPHFRTGVIQSAGLGIKVLVVAEYLTQAQNSIGRELYNGRINLQYESVFAWTIILVIIVVVIEHFVNRYLRYSRK